MSGKSRGTRDGGRVWRRLQTLGVLRVLPLFWTGAGQQVKPAPHLNPPPTDSVSLDKLLRSLLTCVSDGARLLELPPQGSQEKEAVLKAPAT